MSDRLYATFRVGQSAFGIDATDVQEVLRSQPMTKVPLAAAEVSGLINLRGQIVVAVDLRKRLLLGAASTETDPLNIVVRTEHGPVALIVDDIGDVLEAPDSDLEAPPATLKHPTQDMVSAVYKLEDELLLILDVARTAAPAA